MPVISLACSNVFSTAMSVKPFIIPTDWEPCPGNTMASFMRSVFEEHGAPGEAAAHALHQHVVSGPDAPVAHRDVKGERDRCGGSVGVAIDRDDALRFRQSELLRDVRDDS